MWLEFSWPSLSGLGCMLPSNGGIALASLQEGRTPKKEEIVDCTMQS